jgi:hypothetical protein
MLRILAMMAVAAGMISMVMFGGSTAFMVLSSVVLTGVVHGTKAFLDKHRETFRFLIKDFGQTLLDSIKQLPTFISDYTVAPAILYIFSFAIPDEERETPPPPPTTPVAPVAPVAPVTPARRSSHKAEQQKNAARAWAMTENILRGLFSQNTP